MEYDVSDPDYAMWIPPEGTVGPDEVFSVRWLSLETWLEILLRTTQRFFESMVPLESGMEYPSQKA